MILAFISGLEMLIIGALAFLLPLIALIDILRCDFTNNNKLIWVLVVLLFPFFGPILYFIFGLKQKIRK
ncbi:PLD nuclease N-terminal domain-containing protein [Marinifilum caeruleilacunae]|uniref:PLDc_N domain-containing protein n=1 Tax=Marinifilum caeruleilacunae TaxID=2499076 RepID=A0ABX1X295_9BACT|nr:PLD nuclease N-terminal domain-containing protein [Marinifilum caeruleilacunae]NOU62210.1 PLDc_N domain-containing protein [Marinifilum caeruleilacunae]